MIDYKALAIREIRLLEARLRKELPDFTVDQTDEDLLDLDLSELTALLDRLSSLARSIGGLR